MALPYMPFYWGDYWRDTSHLSDAEHVSYLKLISHYWQHGSLPCDDARLSRIAGRSLAEFKKMRSTLAAFFKDDWKHSRIERELKKRKEDHEARVLGGKLTAQKRWGDSSANSSATSSACSNQNQNQNQINNLIIKTARSSSFRKTPPSPDPEVSPELKAELAQKFEGLSKALAEAVEQDRLPIKG